MISAHDYSRNADDAAVRRADDRRVHKTTIIEPFYFFPPPLFYFLFFIFFSFCDDFLHGLPFSTAFYTAPFSLGNLAGILVNGVTNRSPSGVVALFFSFFFFFWLVSLFNERAITQRKQQHGSLGDWGLLLLAI